tara:strand:- start:56 stop:205 length:150 start_codon:yes stop_codon:yes gene_type:complete
MVGAQKAYVKFSTEKNILPKSQEKNEWTAMDNVGNFKKEKSKIPFLCSG